MLSRVKGTPGVSLKTPAAKLKESDGIDFGPTAVFHEKFPNIGKPFFFEEQDWTTLGDGDGYQEYFERKGRTKNSVKYGQLKLFTTEMQFFTKYWNPEEVSNPICVYVGSAPGTHIPFLTELFPWFTFHLYDPRDLFDEKLKTNPRVKLHVQFFTDEDAKKYAKRKDVFFLSDIRTSSYNKEKYSTEKAQKENEALVKEDMERQKRWVEIIQPVKAQLKFRLPYTYNWLKEKTFEYLDGDVYRQAWAPQTSTETRLVVDLSKPMRQWNFPMYEKMLFYHNNVVREHAIFVNPLNNMNSPADTEVGLTQDYDSTLFLVIIQDYMKKFHSKEFVLNSEKSVLALAKAIIDGVGNGEISIANIRAGVKGKLSPDSQDRLRLKLKEMGDDEEDD
jgi:hypothetical protein